MLIDSDRSSLLTYSKHLSLAMQTLARLQSDCMAPSSPGASIPRTQYDYLVCFVPTQVLPVLNKVARELLAMPGISQNFARSIVVVLMGHTMTDRVEVDGKGCTLCHWDQEDHILRSVESTGDAGSKYLSRHYRLVRHLRHTPNEMLSAAEYVRIDAEIDHLSELSAQVLAHVVALFQRHEMDEAAEFAQATGMIHDSSVGYYSFTKGRELRDCLMRSTLHQWLDSIPWTLPNGKPAAPSSWEIKTLRENARLYDLEHRDVLGRSALYIVSKRGWLSVVDILLEAGADATIVTMQGRQSAIGDGKTVSEIPSGSLEPQRLTDWTSDSPRTVGY
jgi:hypothetical protein